MESCVGVCCQGTKSHALSVRRWLIFDVVVVFKYVLDQPHMTHVATIVANILTLHFLLISGGIPFSKGIMSSFPSSCSGKRSTNGSKHCYSWIMSKPLVSLIESSFCIWAFLLWACVYVLPQIDSMDWLWYVNDLSQAPLNFVDWTVQSESFEGPLQWSESQPRQKIIVHRILINKFLKHIYVNKKQVPIRCFKLHLSHFMAFMQPKCVLKTNRLSPDEHNFWHGWCYQSSKWAR